MHEHPLIKKPYDPAEHQYPQWVKVGGKDVLVANEAEHEIVLAGGEIPEVPAVQPIDPKAPYDPSLHQYPQWVTVKVDGKDKAFLVQDEAEHAQLLGKDKAEILDKNALMAEADKRGLKIDKRWSAEKIRDALAAG